MFSDTHGNSDLRLLPELNRLISLRQRTTPFRSGRDPPGLDWLPHSFDSSWFFRKAQAQPHTVNPRTITVDKNPAYPRATAEMKRKGELWRFTRLRQC
jgi:hypothetical protein